MDFKPLENVGFTLNEANIFCTLSKVGPMTAGKIAKKTGIHRSRVYASLERLMQKGLVHFTVINKTKNFRAKNTESLLELIEERKEELEKFIPQLSINILEKDSETEQTVEAYRGIGGVKALLNETLKKNYDVFGGPQQSLSIMGELYWTNYNQKINENKIKTRMIFNENLRDWSKTIKSINKSTTIRFLEKQFDNITENFVLDDCVIIIVWTQQPIGVALRDKFIASSYNNFFEMLWKLAKK